MSKPHPEAVQHAEATVVRAAISRGYLTQDQLREALLIREDLRSGGQEVGLLKVLGARFLTQEHQTLLTNVYFSALGGAPTDPDGQPAPQSGSGSGRLEGPDMLYSSEDELAIPEFSMGRSSELLARPPEEDPEAVKELLAASAEVEAPTLDLGDDGPDGPQDQVSSETGEGDGPADESGSGIWRWLRGKK